MSAISELRRKLHCFAFQHNYHLTQFARDSEARDVLPRRGAKRVAEDSKCPLKRNVREARAPSTMTQ